MRAGNCPETSSRTSNSDSIRLKTHVNQKGRGKPSFLSLLYGSFHPSMAVSQLESRAICKLVIDHIFHLYKIKSSVGFASLQFNFIQMKYMINNLYLQSNMIITSLFRKLKKYQQIIERQTSKELLVG